MITVLPPPLTSPPKPIQAYVPAPQQLPKTSTPAPTPTPTTIVLVPVPVEKSPEQVAAGEYLRAKLHVPIPLNSKGQAQLFVNIRNSETETTLLFDGYNKNIPDSNSVRGEKCDSNTEQVYPSSSVPNTYTITQRHTGWILTYPTTPMIGSPLTVENVSKSLWEIHESPEAYWITSLALTVSEDSRQITLEHASTGNPNQKTGQAFPTSFSSGVRVYSIFALPDAAPNIRIWFLDGHLTMCFGFRFFHKFCKIYYLDSVLLSLSYEVLTSP